MMLRASELAAIRADLDALLPDTCTVERATWASDGMGGSTSAWAAAGTIDCRLGPTEPDERAGETVARAVDEWTMVVPASADVTRSDRLSLGGTLFYVVGKRTHATLTLNQVLDVSTVAPS